MPVECFYLPLHENWPSPMEGQLQRRLLGRPRLSRIVSPGFRRGLATDRRARSSQALERDALPGLPNNKNNFKANGWSRGSSPWLLDEPANFQDFWALRYFARPSTRASTRRRERPRSQASASSPRLVFRADISRPQWRRDSLDGLLDYHVVGGAMRDLSPPRLRSQAQLRRDRSGVRLDQLVEGSNVQPAAWCLDAWSLGTDGVLPWQTIGNSESWKQADELALFYPHPAQDRPGRTAARPLAPIPSIRLKAYRRGQQDVEYLTLWSQLHSQPRWAVGQQVRAALKLAGTRQSTGFAGGDDAGRIDYGRLRPQDIWASAWQSAKPSPRPILLRNPSWSISAHPAETRNICHLATEGNPAHR